MDERQLNATQAYVGFPPSGTWQRGRVEVEQAYQKQGAEERE